MNDESSQEKTASNAMEEPVKALAGQRLAEARRANSISIAEIAKELHLDEPKVQALEENQFEVLGAPVFAKGHLRKYAELVGVSRDDVLADYYQLNRAAGAPPVVGPKKAKPPRNIRPGPWILFLVLAIAIGGALAWWFAREPAPEITGTPGVLEPFATDRQDADPERAVDALPTGDIAGINDAGTDLPELSRGSVSNETLGDDLGAENGDVLPESPLEIPVSANESQSAGARTSGRSGAVAIPGGVRLVMTFSGDCWTEVTDANGDRLFFGLGEAGQTISRDGMPPLQALFGDRNNVSVMVDGVEFPLSGRGLRGNTAQITIEAS